MIWRKYGRRKHYLGTWPLTRCVDAPFRYRWGALYGKYKWRAKKHPRRYRLYHVMDGAITLFDTVRMVDIYPDGTYTVADERRIGEGWNG